MRFALAAGGAAALFASAPLQAAITVVDFQGGSMSPDGKIYTDNGIEFRAIGTFDFFGFGGGPHVDLAPYSNRGYEISAGARLFSFLSFDAVCCEPDDMDGMTGTGVIEAYDRKGVRLFRVSFAGSPRNTVSLDDRHNVASLRFGGDHVSIDNLVFNVIPEPSTWATLILGFGLVCAVSRRRHRPALS